MGCWGCDELYDKVLDLEELLEESNKYISALKLLIKTECPHGLCENFLGCHSTRLDKWCIGCPDFVLDETIINRYKERMK